MKKTARKAFCMLLALMLSLCLLCSCEGNKQTDEEASASSSAADGAQTTQEDTPSTTTVPQGGMNFGELPILWE